MQYKQIIIGSRCLPYITHWFGKMYDYSMYTLRESPEPHSALSFHPLLTISQSRHLHQTTGQRLSSSLTMPLMWLTGLGISHCLSHSRSHTPPFSSLAITSPILILASYSRVTFSQVRDTTRSALSFLCLTVYCGDILFC